MPPPTRSRNWCGTFNGPRLPTKDELTDAINDYIGDDSTFRYFGVAVEHAGQTGREHLQFYFQVNNPITSSRARSLLSSVGLRNAHVEACRGSVHDNLAYIRKEDPDPLELGNPTSQGSGGGNPNGNKLAQRIANREIKTVREAMMADPVAFAIHHAGLTKLINALQEPRRLDEMPKVIWRFGGTGTGKSMWCQQQADALGDPTMVYEYSSGQKGWFDDYAGQEYMIIQELRAHDFQVSVLLQLLDQYACRVQVKGGFVQILTHTFWITSPVHPRKLFPNAFQKDEGKADQLKRRITEIWHHEKNKAPVQVDWDWSKDDGSANAFEDEPTNPFA